MNRVIISLLALFAVPSRPTAQVVASVSGSYESLPEGHDWSTAGGQVSLRWGSGYGLWVAGERVGRFGVTDGGGRLGTVLHPLPRLWIAIEAGAAAQPEFLPKNTWEIDVTTLAARTALGVAYRRWNYVVGPVNMLVPHLSIEAPGVGVDIRVPLSRTTAEQTDASVMVRITHRVGARMAAWLLGAAGRESFVEGTVPTQTVHSIETLTAAGGLRYNAPGGLTLRVDGTFIDAERNLSRRGMGIGLERAF